MCDSTSLDRLGPARHAHSLQQRKAVFERIIIFVATAFRWLIFAIIHRAGRVPKHVAFIMDGNRRYADARAEKPSVGHNKGYKKLAEVIRWCAELGVAHISVYAFSIDNFRRSPDEVSHLMELACNRYRELAEDSSVVGAHRIKVRVVGDLSLAPHDVQAAAIEVMSASAQRARGTGTCDVYFAYTSTFELAQSLATEWCSQSGEAYQCMAKGVVDSRTMWAEDSKMLVQSPAVDLLVRTSGESRLSDFLVWQSQFAQLVWVQSMWPEFSLLDFVGCVLGYQQSWPALNALRAKCDRMAACRS